MADTYKDEQVAHLKFFLRSEDGVSTTTRTIVVDNAYGFEDAETWNAFRRKALTAYEEFTTGGLSGVVQPASWRDIDGDEAAYTLDNLEISLVNTRTYTIDPEED